MIGDYYIGTYSVAMVNIFLGVPTAFTGFLNANLAKYSTENKTSVLLQIQIAYKATKISFFGSKILLIYVYL